MRYHRTVIVGLVALALGAAAGWCQTEDEFDYEPAVPSAEGLQGERRISMDLQDANIKDVFKIFSQQSGLNFIAGEEIGNRRLTLYLDRVSVQDALDQIVRANGFTYEKLSGSNIFIVHGAAGPATVTRIYKLKYARVSSSILGRAVSAFGKITPFEGMQGFGSSTGGGGSSGAGGGSSGTAAKDIDIGIDKVIVKLLTEAGTVVADERTNSLVVTDVADNFPRIEQAIAQLDVKTPQVLIETELVEVAATKAKDLGIEWGTGSDGAIVTLTPASSTIGFPFGSLTNRTRGTLGGSITLGTLNTAQAVAVLKALESDSRTKVLARPKVLTLDNESATIRLSAQTAIGSLTTTIGTTGTSTETAERTETGIRLVVTPQVNEDGYMTLLIEPSVSRPVQSTFFKTGSKNFVDPKTRSARTLVRVKDGETIVLGGLIDLQETNTIRKVPLLGDLPLIGGLFRKEDVDKDETELMVFITPRLVKDEPQVAQATQPPLVTEPTTQREQEMPRVRRDDAIESMLNRMEGHVQGR